MPIPSGSRATLAVSVGGAGLAAALLALIPDRGVHLAAEPPAVATPAPAETRHAESHGRYAASRLRLAQADLAKAEDLAQAVPGQVTERELANLRRRVEGLEQHVGVTMRVPHGNSPALARAAAATAVQQADDDLFKAKAASRRQKAAVSPLELARLQAAADLARARRELWDDPSFLDSPLQMMQMQIDQLSDDLFELTHRVDNSPALDRR